jgi:peptidoglycan hydrolase-like protein with peptidoglycan-binding domain
LKQGATGGDVRRLHVLLAPAVFGASGKPEFFGTEYAESKYGPSTAAYVEILQERAGLKKDGIAGPNTWAELGESGASCGSAVSAYSPGPAPVLSGAEVPFYKEGWFLWAVGAATVATAAAILFWPKKAT